MLDTAINKIWSDRYRWIVGTAWQQRWTASGRDDAGRLKCIHQLLVSFNLKNIFRHVYTVCNVLQNANISSLKWRTAFWHPLISAQKNQRPESDTLINSFIHSISACTLAAALPSQYPLFNHWFLLWGIPVPGIHDWASARTHVLSPIHGQQFSRRRRGQACSEGRQRCLFWPSKGIAVLGTYTSRRATLCLHIQLFIPT